MKFTSDEVVKAPIEHVFRACTDFGTFARLGRKRGAVVERTDDLEAPGAGMAWNLAFRLRGRVREVDVTMRRFDPSTGFVAHSLSGGLEAVISLKLTAIPPGGTRMTSSINIQARSLPGRIIMQSLRLVRGRLKRRINQRAEAFARRIELDWRRKLIRRGAQ